MKIKCIYSLAALLLLMACSKNKDEASNSADVKANAPYFKSGNGIKYLTTYSEPVSGRFPTAGSLALSLTDDQKIHWVFFRNSAIFRKTVNVANGDTLATEGNLQKVGARMIDNPYDGAEPDRYLFVPYSNKLYRSYRSGPAEYKVVGDVPNFTIGGYDGKAIQPLLYANGDVMMHYAGNISANLGEITTMIGAYLSHNGVLSHARVEKTLPNGARSTAYDRIYHGGITFPADNNGGLKSFGFTNYKAYLFKHSATATAVTDSIDYAGVPFNVGSVVPNVPFFAKTSKDMSKTTLLCYEPDDRKNFSGKYKFSTFIIDNTTNKIQLVVNKQLMPLMEYDFDLEGNIYFADNASGAKITKLSAAGESTFAQNFFGATAISKIYAQGGKIFLVCTAGTTTESRISLFVSQ